MVHYKIMTSSDSHTSESVIVVNISMNFRFLKRVMTVFTVIQTMIRILRTSRATGPSGLLANGIKNGRISIFVPDKSPAADYSKRTVIEVKMLD